MNPRIPGGALEGRFYANIRDKGKRKFKVYGHFEEPATLAFGAGVFDFTHEEVLKGIIFWD